MLGSLSNRALILTDLLFFTYGNKTLDLSIVAEHSEVKPGINRWGKRRIEWSNCEIVYRIFRLNLTFKSCSLLADVSFYGMEGMIEVRA